MNSFVDAKTETEHLLDKSSEMGTLLTAKGGDNRVRWSLTLPGTECIRGVDWIGGLRAAQGKLVAPACAGDGHDRNHWRRVLKNQRLRFVVGVQYIFRRNSEREIQQDKDEDAKKNVQSHLGT